MPNPRTADIPASSVTSSHHPSATSKRKSPKARYTMQRQLMDLRSGKINFDQFGRNTFSEWERMAFSLSRKWECPPGVGLEDIVQELLFAAWRFVDKWDPKYGVKIQRYVTYNAMDKAKKWMHTQRQAGTAGDKGKSRHPYAFASIGGDDVALLKASNSGSPEEHCCAYERGVSLSRQLAGQDISRENKAWILMFAECGWDPDKAAVEVFHDSEARQFFQLESFELARVAAHNAMDVATRVARRELTLD